MDNILKFSLDGQEPVVDDRQFEFFGTLTDGIQRIAMLRVRIRVFLLLLVATTSTLWCNSAIAVDVAKAEQHIKSNNCGKCHVVDRTKDGPAYRDVAAKFKADPDAEKKVIFHMTSGEMVKFPDGHEERHKKIKTTDPAELQNIAQWILSLEGGKKY